jgi:hypothetical protein
MSILKRVLQKILVLVLIFFGLFFGLLIPEIGLRLIGFEAPIFQTVDSSRGWIDKPGFSGFYSTEGGSYVQINSQGFRGREHFKDKPKNTIRIALLGDSMVASYEVSEDQDTARLTERILNKNLDSTGKKVEVIKFGVPGYGTDQELITLREKVWDYSPDIVILLFYHYNDVINNYRALNSDAYDINHIKPYFIYNDGHLILDNSYLSSSKYQANLSWWSKYLDKVRDHSRLLQLLSKVESSLCIGRKLAILWHPINENLTPTIYDNVYKEPSDLQWQQAWQITEELIKLMNSEVKAKGSDFIVVTVSDGVQIYPDPSVRQKFMQRLGVTDLFYPERRIQSLGDRYGFKVIRLAPIFQKYADENKICLQGFDNFIACQGHLNKYGHQLASEVISKKLLQEIQ